MSKLNLKITISLSILFFVFLPVTVFSQETDSPEITSSSSAESIQENLKERIKNVVKENLDQTELSLREKINQQTLMGFAGQITKLTDESITIKNEDKNLQIVTNEETVLVRNNQNIKVSSLSIDERIIVIGNLNSEDILTAKRIVTTTSKEATVKRQTFVGHILDIDIKNDSFELLNQDNVSVTISLPSKSTTDIEDLSANQNIIIIVETDLEDNTHSLLQLKNLS